MNATTTEAVGLTLFGIVVVICLAVTIIAGVNIGSNAVTERLVACVEAGRQFIEGTCI